MESEEKPLRIPVPGIEYPILLGDSIGKEDDGFDQLKYEFKPRSVDCTSLGSFDLDPENKVAVVLNNKNSSEQLLFNGKMQACKELDFMLFWDPEEEVFYLEKVNRFVHLRHNRQGVKRKSTHPSDYKTVVAPLKQNPSNPRNYNSQKSTRIEESIEFDDQSSRHDSDSKDSNAETPEISSTLRSPSPPSIIQNSSPKQEPSSHFSSPNPSPSKILRKNIEESGLDMKEILRSAEFIEEDDFD